MRMAASWSGPVAGRPDTRLWRAGPRPGAGSPPIVILGQRPAACCRAAGWEVPQPLALDTRSPIQAGSPPIVILGQRPAACCRAAGWEVPQPLALDTRSPIQARGCSAAGVEG